MTDTPTTTPKLFCFVLMPFANEFKDIYTIGIEEACAAAGTYCERVDKQIYDGTVLQRIYNQIAKADVVVADMTGRNPNVFYEVGYAHALGKTTVLLTENADDIPFDLRPYPHIVYARTDLVQLRQDLTERLQYYVAHPPEAHAAPTIDIECYAGSTNLASGGAMVEYRLDTKKIEIAVYNRSLDVFEDCTFQIGLLTSDKFDNAYNVLGNHEVITVQPSPFEFLHILSNTGRLLPHAYSLFSFVLNPTNPPNNGYAEQVIVRVFTLAGTRDFPLTLRCVNPKE